jgi:mono/diheme cytochrome c family protein
MSHEAARRIIPLIAAFAISACGGGLPETASIAPSANANANDDDIVALGRALVIDHDCGGCHGGGTDPGADGWLAGSRGPEFEFKIGPCALDPTKQPCFTTRPRNLTPDNQTGLGRFTERQIFNSLRFGLRPGETPDVDITSSTPGQGNFPAQPKYLAPPMPWTYWRHASDQELRAIAAYLKRGVKPVSNKVEDSEGPPDFWASDYAVDKIGTFPAPAFPTANEMMPAGASAELSERIARGRQRVLDHACGGCHGGADPAASGWLQGSRAPEMDFKIGPCATDPNAKGPCFNTRPRNLTPDNVTGLGRFSERQIFNALRFGLRPGDTPDVEITSSTPGQGNFPAQPKYVAPPMPWPGWRHMSDADLWAIAAYLKHGLKPVSNKVKDSEGPPDFWASGYTLDKIGPHPARPFPTVHEMKQ